MICGSNQLMEQMDSVDPWVKMLSISSCSISFFLQERKLYTVNFKNAFVWAFCRKWLDVGRTPSRSWSHGFSGLSSYFAFCCIVFLPPYVNRTNAHVGFFFFLFSLVYVIHWKIKYIDFLEHRDHAYKNHTFTAYWCL